MCKQRNVFSGVSLFFHVSNPQISHLKKSILPNGHDKLKQTHTWLTERKPYFEKTLCFPSKILISTLVTF